MAIPVSILIASVMVYGDMAEKFELSSFKSAGVSLLRIMAVGIGIATVTSMFSLVASNYLKPKAQYSFLERFYSIRRQKPTLSIGAGVFNKDFSNYTIRVGKKDPDGRGISDVKIYDQSQNDKSKVNFVVANTGEMFPDDSGDAFVMQLYDGEQYRELDSKKNSNAEGGSKTYPFMRTKFGSWRKVFDMSQFELDAKSVNLSRKKYDLLNAFQIMEAIDSLDRKKAEEAKMAIYSFGDIIKPEIIERESIFTKAAELDKKEDLMAPEIQAEKFTDQNMRTKKSSIVQNKVEDITAEKDFVSTFKLNDQRRLVKKALNQVRIGRENVIKRKTHQKILSREQDWFKLRLNQQFSWAIVCILFLFIGAPLGSIVRKGGYGYPLLVSIIFFMFFIVFNIMGEKLMGSSSLNPFLAAWLPCIVCLPFSIFLTYKAVRDESLNLGDLPPILWLKKKFLKEDLIA